MERTLYSRMNSPIGELLLRSDGTCLTGLFMRPQGVRVNGWTRDEAALKPARQQLEAYFAGELKDFALPFQGRGTDFQQTVWKALCAIPYGETLSYGELARRIGQPTAARAVGLANGQNPISIIVPCHRVIGANGTLTGYGGGLPRKKWLLAHEAAHSGLFA
jgi:methylated-DNA-[protein]-cysteine S-methyltransferase